MNVRSDTDIYVNELIKPIDCECPVCGEAGLSVFYELMGLPAQGDFLIPTEEEAIDFPRGDIKLGYCKECGLIKNLSFDPFLVEYSSGYEGTQEFSPFYNTYSRELASRLIEKHGVRNKEVIDIGAGKGGFLTLLCELGDNRGVGFDPSYEAGRALSKPRRNANFIQDFYSGKYSAYRGDLYVCRLTLEHMPDAAAFLKKLRTYIGAGSDTVLFFQVPDSKRMLEELAFWDICHEHAFYFSRTSIERMMMESGFEVLDVREDFYGRYLSLEARPLKKASTGAGRYGKGCLSGLVEFFSENHRQKIALWKTKLKEISESGYRTVLWGSGPKASSFLTALDIKDEIKYVVDINPYKHGTYLACTGHRIVSPAYLKEYRPDAVIIMNPAYADEIKHEVKKMKVSAEFMMP